jgi:acetoin utilization protein AcuC
VITYGLGTSDVPIFGDMHDAALAIVGGTLRAGELFLSDSHRRVLQLGGGLHHAMHARAAGFCVYNDVAALVAQLVANGKRVLYLDIDVHHGDGVQWIHYADDRVMTLSLHESGMYLFPGTGFVDEVGSGDGEGYSLNIPLEPGTGHESYLEVFSSIVPEAVARFSPDVVVLETGADAHVADPLAHLALTTETYIELFRRIIELADTHAEGRLIATLGGGYDIDATVRVWTLLLLSLSESALPEELPREWRDSWRIRKGIRLSPELRDEVAGRETPADIHGRNLNTVSDLRSRLGW